MCRWSARSKPLARCSSHPITTATMESDASTENPPSISGSDSNLPATCSSRGTSEDNSEWGQSSCSQAVLDVALAGQVKEEPEQDDSSDVFTFESDHVALKGNPDYHALIHTIAMLEVQRCQAIQDLDRLIDCERQALRDPIGFVEKLQNGCDLDLPRPLKVMSLPEVRWEQYTSNVDPLNLAARKHMTRKRRTGSSNIASDIKPVHLAFPQSSSPHPQQQSEESTAAMEDGTSANSKPELVRGRVKDESKPVTFNKLWTAEEQQRLEELLLEHPPEPVEARRWAKVAKALGNRTPQQVTSRVQKYFIRLAKAGLPIPGRMPNLNTYSKKGGIHRHQRFNRFYFQPSTFLQSYQPPVFMPDGDDDRLGNHSGRPLGGGRQSLRPDDDEDDDDDVSDEEGVPPEKRLTVEYQELMRLKRLQRKKLAEQRTRQHLGYRCDQCNCEPIVGTRWHCADCNQDVSVDFCDECMDCQYDNGTHQPSHRLEPVYLDKANQPHVDADYMHFTPQGSYNYLDPNYMPAT